MNCPNCGAEYTELQDVNQVSDKTNKFGRREIKFIAEHENPVVWNMEYKKYQCKRCNTSFTFQEGTLQAERREA